MKFTVKIKTDNAALSDDPLRACELGRIVGNIQCAVRSGSYGGSCYDYNGNQVGSWHLEWEESA